MKLDDLFNEGITGDIAHSAKKFWHGTSGEISRERRWPMAYEKSMIAYKNAVNSGDFAAIDKNSDLVNYFALLTGKPTLKSFENRLLRQHWTKSDFVDYVKKHYADDVAKANSGQMEESCPDCGGVLVHESMVNEKKDACYYKVKRRYKIWPSAYASGALVQCRKKGAANWGKK